MCPNCSTSGGRGVTQTVCWRAPHVSVLGSHGVSGCAVVGLDAGVIVCVCVQTAAVSSGLCVTVCAPTCVFPVQGIALRWS